MYNAYTARGGFSVTPSDITELGPPMVMRLKVISAGMLALTTEDGSVLAPFPVNSGEVVEMRTRKVMATGTTATVQAWY